MISHDRKTLEAIYADEFIFIHGFGFIENKSEQVNGIMESDSISGIPLPSFDQLMVYGNTAVLRNKGRGAGGNPTMSTTIYIKKDDRWQIIQVQTTLQQKERKLISLDNSVLDLYIGKYEQAPGIHTFIAKQGDNLTAQRTGRPKIRLDAVGENLFFDKFGSEIKFYIKDEKVTHYVIKIQNGQELMWKKVA